jgi:hypothetical protein
LLARDDERLRVALLMAREGVSMSPGTTALTVMPYRPSSNAADFMRPMIPHFEAE